MYTRHCVCITEVASEEAVNEEVHNEGTDEVITPATTIVTEAAPPPSSHFSDTNELRHRWDGNIC